MHHTHIKKLSGRQLYCWWMRRPFCNIRHRISHEAAATGARELLQVLGQLANTARRLEPACLLTSSQLWKHHITVPAALAPR